MIAAPAVSPSRQGAGHMLNHIYCCDPNLSLCGLDLSDVPETDSETDCTVCLDLEYETCPSCDG